MWPRCTRIAAITTLRCSGSSGRTNCRISGFSKSSVSICSKAWPMPALPGGSAQDEAAGVASSVDHCNRHVTKTSTQPSDEGLWARLRRRKVVQWGLVYIAGAWGFLQGLEYVSESFHWPEQFRQIALLALLIGLPIVLVLAWYHGDRGQQRITTTEFAILTLLLLLGGGAFWYYQRTSETATVATPRSGTAANDRSIAVLPFVNVSADKEQEYFADGISEELLNLLAQVPELRVIARTSSFSFKGKEVDIAEIARRLNVANVLEGSVRKSGDTLRITD